TGNTAPPNLKLIKIKVFNIRKAIDNLLDLSKAAAGADKYFLHTSNLATATDTPFEYLYHHLAMRSIWGLF
ncbi:MAG: hypothetical protein EBY90_04325, partial [Actinobacteria bacterium]|nr:hypothetical protein [Actinomycetota bacterium]